MLARGFGGAGQRAQTARVTERLQHPQVGGVVLFARNFAAPLQLIQLTHSIREIRKPSILIAVDHEELAEAQWWSRAGLLAALQARELALPPSVSIARRIIEAWYGGPLPGQW